MEVINDLLNFKNLKIVQDTKWFKFSLDSVLLANFVTINNSKIKIIDFCTGNAPIPLILSSRGVNNIIGVELQKEVYALAKKTLGINDNTFQIELLNDDIKNLKKIYISDSFDTITCNPPYFKVYENSVLNDNSIKSIARHELKINLDDIFSTAKYLLKNNGNIAIVHRTERLLEIIEKMQKNNLEPKKLQFVYPKENSESNIILIEATKNGKPGIKILPPMFVHDEDGNYRENIIKMFK